MELLRALKFPAVLAVIVGAVWVAAWERHLTSVAKGAYLPATAYVIPDPAPDSTVDAADPPDVPIAAE
jgi:hypothetical protein